jgi:TIR domain/PDZ domain
VTDIFFSYSSVDRERVRPIRDALVVQGFEVFWDQEVPTGLDWDSWIRQHLAKSKCAMAFWSAASVASDNVRHEAVVAKQQGKLISVLLEPLTAQQFPMGLYAQQAANLAGWDGDTNQSEWRKLQREYESKLMPAWVRRQINELEAELVGERARREGAEHRDSVLQAQIAKEAKTQQELKRERNEAREEVAALKTTVEELTRARSEAEAREADTLRQVAAFRATVDEVTRARSDAEQRLSKVRQIKAKEIVRVVSPFVIAAAVATVGIWTYQLIWPAPQPVPAVISESMAEAERELAAIKEEGHRQAKAAADAEAKREAAEAEQQRLKDEVQRQTKAAAEADSKRETAEAEQQQLKERLINELQRQAKATSGAEAQFTAGPKKILGMELVGMSDDLPKRYGIKDTVKGLIITGIEQDSPAADKRLSPGDVIVEIAQEAVANADDLQAKIDMLKKDGHRSALLLVAGPDGESRFVALNLK